MPETSVTSAAAGRTPPGTGDEPDGRSMRAERTRAAVVEALLELNDRGHLRPTAADIANEAGVSTRTLYVHFADLEALVVAASERQRERIDAALPPLVSTGAFDERLDAFVRRRTGLHEFGKGVRRAAVLQEPFSPAMQDVLRSARKALRAEVRHCFRPEIEAAGDGGDELLWALDATASSATWEALRAQPGRSEESARAQLRRMLRALVAEWSPASVGGGT